MATHQESYCLTLRQGYHSQADHNYGQSCRSRMILFLLLHMTQIYFIKLRAINISSRLLVLIYFTLKLLNYINLITLALR